MRQHDLIQRRSERRLRHVVLLAFVCTMTAQNTSVREFKLRWSTTFAVISFSVCDIRETRPASLWAAIFAKMGLQSLRLFLRNSNGTCHKKKLNQSSPIAPKKHSLGSLFYRRLADIPRDVFYLFCILVH